MISKSQIKDIKAIHSKKQREIEKCFIAEGIKIVKEIIEEDPLLIKKLFCTEAFLAENKTHLRLNKIDPFLISAKELSLISQLSTPNDALAICNYIKTDVITTNFDTQFAFYLDDIRDPGNLGTIIRICSWFGVKELFCSPTTVELYNPKCIQSTMGAFLRVKVHYIALHELITNLKIKNLYSTELKGKNLYEEDLKNGLILIGNEANGISQQSKSLANRCITIPSAAGNTESLNAAIAVSIIASEFFRRAL